MTIGGAVISVVIWLQFMNQTPNVAPPSEVKQSASTHEKGSTSSEDITAHKNPQDHADTVRPEYPFLKWGHIILITVCFSYSLLAQLEVFDVISDISDINESCGNIPFFIFVPGVYLSAIILTWDAIVWFVGKPYPGSYFQLSVVLLCSFIAAIVTLIMLGVKWKAQGKT